MMIAKLFYPREMKKVVRYLKDKNDLNEHALKLFHRNINLALGAWGLILCAIYYGQDYVIFFILLTIFPVLFWLSYAAWYKRFMRPYIIGKKVSGYVSNIFYYRHRRIEYHIHDLVGQKTYKLPKFYLWRKTNRPDKKDQMNIYVDPKKTGQAMPDHPYFKKMFCLSKKIMEQN